jgi:putative NADH-flavin reductase
MTATEVLEQIGETPTTPAAVVKRVAMRVLVLGTGSIGRRIASQGLSRNYELTVFARQPRPLPSSERLRVIQGDALDPVSVHAAVSGQQAVIYALGIVTRRTTLFSDSTRILIDAMVSQGVRRLVAVTGVGAGETKGHGGFVYDRVVFPIFTKGIYEDKDRQEALIRSSTLDWVIVRPAPFKDRTPPGPLRVVTDIRGTTLRGISRDEVAAFVLDQLESDRYLHQTPFIGHE